MNLYTESEENQRETHDDETITLVLNSLNDLPPAEIPPYCELWNWEGDEDVLPSKWLALVRQSFGEQFCQANAISSDTIHAFVAHDSFFDKQGFFFITERSRCIGTVFVWPSDRGEKGEGRVHWLAVSPDARRRGVAKALVISALQHMRSRFG